MYFLLVSDSFKISNRRFLHTWLQNFFGIVNLGYIIDTQNVVQPTEITLSM